MLNYKKLVISETSPSTIIVGTLWLKPSEGQMFIQLTDSLYPIFGGQSFSYVAGATEYWYRVWIQNTEPSGAINSDFWIQNYSSGQEQVWLKIGKWIPVGGSLANA